MLRLSTGFRTKLAGTSGFGETFANGVMQLYSGPQPLTADAAVSGTLLGIVTTGGGVFAFGTATNGLAFEAAASGAIAKKITDAWQYTGLAAGTIGWARLMGNASDNLGISTTLPRVDMSVGVSGADLNISNIAVEIGVPGTIDVFQFTVPAQ
jgi:hypothetical protein